MREIFRANELEVNTCLFDFVLNVRVKGFNNKRFSNPIIGFEVHFIVETHVIIMYY